jgi:hypothetical protein
VSPTRQKPPRRLKSFASQCQLIQDGRGEVIATSCAPALAGQGETARLAPTRLDYDLSPGCFHQGSLLGGADGGIGVAAADCWVLGDG